MVTKPDDRLKLVSTVIEQKYAIDRVLREDDFFVDYDATQLIVNRRVVVRVFVGLAEVEGHARSLLCNDFLADQAKLAELASTAPALRAIRDAGTLPLPGGGWLPFVIEESSSGESLAADLNERRLAHIAYTLPDAVHALDGIAGGLAIAHDIGLVHGLVAQDDVWVLDSGIVLRNFGLSRLAARARELNGIPIASSSAPDSTPSSQLSSPQHDVFGLASLLVQMCGPSPAGMNAAASAVLARALNAAPMKGWRDAGEFWNALRSALALPVMRSLTKTIPPDVTGASAPTSLHRTRLLIMSLTLLLVGIAVGVLRTSCMPESSQHGVGQDGVRDRQSP